MGEIVKVMGKKKVLVKVQPEGKYGASSIILSFWSHGGPCAGPRR